MLDEVLTRYGEYICGVDEYFGFECEYPEVYAKFSIALFKKWEKTYNQKYKESAYRYLERMCELGIETEEWMYWGLPFDWGGTKKEDGFLITTCFCIQALNIWEDDQWEHIIEKAKSWCFTLASIYPNGQAEIFYSPKLEQHIYNASSMACGTLLECTKLAPEDKNIVYKVLDCIIYKQKRNGYWNYSDQKCDVDLVHQSYTVEGLIRSYPYISDPELKNNVKISIDKGLKFLLNQLPVNAKSERYLFRLLDEEKLGIKIKHLFLRCLRKLHDDEHHFPSIRCWSYAALLRVLCYGECFIGEQYGKEIDMCLNQIHNDLFTGIYFKYKKNADRNFIRHQAHMVEALSYVLEQKN